MGDPSALDRQAVLDGYDRARRTFHALLDEATPADLARPTSGTRWTNGQLLWHMLFGYFVTRVLLGLGRGFSRLPGSVSKAFARVLDAGTRPFDVINYLGPCGAVKVLGPRRMAAAFDRVTGALERRLTKESEHEERTRLARAGRSGAPSSAAEAAYRAADVADSDSSSRSAHRCLIAWKLPIGRPNCTRVFA